MYVGGMETPMVTRKQIAAKQVQPGDTVLVDPLDMRTTAEVADISRSQYTTRTTLELWEGPSGRFLECSLDNDDLVTVLR